MKKYKVYIADKFTRMPLCTYEVEALSKRHAASIVYRKVCQKDKSYLYLPVRKYED